MSDPLVCKNPNCQRKLVVLGSDEHGDRVFCNFCSIEYYINARPAARETTTAQTIARNGLDAVTLELIYMLVTALHGRVLHQINRLELRTSPTALHLDGQSQAICNLKKLLTDLLDGKKLQMDSNGQMAVEP